jgi:hypothetical protein
MALGFESVSFLAQLEEGSESGFALGGFFAFALTARKFDAIVMDGAFKKAVVIWPRSGCDIILGRLGGNSLEKFLEFALGIFERGNDGQRADSAMKLAKDEFTGRIKTAIEENRPEQRFESVRKSGSAVAATVEFFASAQDEMFAEAKLARVFGESPPIDEFSAGFRQRAFAEGRKILVKLASENELEDGITEELKTLVGLDGNTLFVSD